MELALSVHPHVVFGGIYTVEGNLITAKVFHQIRHAARMKMNVSTGTIFRHCLLLLMLLLLLL